MHLSKKNKSKKISSKDTTSIPTTCNLFSYLRYKNNFTESELNNTNEMVRRVFSLENATPKEILKYRISQAVKKYQTSLLDHGSAAIQCASMSEKIILMMQHIKKYPKDTTAARSLVELIQKRRNMLDYLMRTDYHRYKWICVDYGIPETTSKTAHHKTDFKLFINPSRGL
jgi:small subunit ribosomal protein S15